MLTSQSPLGAVGSAEVAKKLKYGQGSIKERTRKNSNGSIYSWYQVRWWDEFGFQHMKTARTKEQAEKLLSQSHKRSMKAPRKSLVTFGEYIREWYETNRSQECGKLRNQSNLTQINNIPQWLMDKPLGQIVSDDLQKHLNSIQQPHPKVQIKQLFTACLRHARANGQIKIDFGAMLKADLPEAKEKPILPREREQEYLDLLPEDYRDYAIGLIYTGTRLAEFMSLNENWQTDIDYVNKKVKIRETKSLREKDRRAGIKFIIREIPLLDPIANLKFPLKQVKQKTVNKNFAKAVEKFGENLTPHCLRHTFITRCDELKINDKASMSWTGHKTRKIHDRYKHKTTIIMDEATDRLMKSTLISTLIQTENKEKEPSTDSETD